ncbi:MAG TPA: hypothetical protein VHA35_05540 [Dongiaceae bacterium]|nr:hypothetical protein [Dongiaceae bacterium]
MLAWLLFHAGLALAATLLAGGAALAQADAGAQINDGTFPADFDCSTLDAPRARLECRTFQSHRAPNDIAPNDMMPPGTPAIPMPGRSNSMDGPYLGLGPNPGPRNFLHGRRPAHGE